MSNIIFGDGFIGNILVEEMGGYVLTKVNPLFYEKLCKVLDEYNPEVVINCIGKTGRPDIDWCEENKEETLLSNTIVPSILAHECSKRGLHFVHIGSGCVFSNRNGEDFFAEDDEPNFYGYQFYADTKILAEKIVDVFPTALQVRIRMPICSYPHERNLITKLIKYDRVIDIQNSMTIIDDFVVALKILIDNRAVGKYNLVNNGTISPCEIMHMYRKTVDHNHIFDIKTREELNSSTVAERSNCILSSDKVELNYGFMMPDIRESLEVILYKYKKFLGDKDASSRP